MDIISWIFTGLIVGAIAKLIMPGKDPGGIIVTILLGITGALLAAFTSRALGIGTGDSWIGWIASIFGSVILLVVYWLIVGRRASPLRACALFYLAGRTAGVG